MRRLVLLALVAGCGGDGPATIDAGPTADAFDRTCNVLTQTDCTTSAAAPKCSVADVGGMLVPTCVEDTGQVAVGQACMRTTIGVDNCAKGLWCSGLGQAIDAMGMPAARFCRSFCDEDGDCAAGQHCHRFLATPKKVGFCLPSGCAFFDPACPERTSCQPFPLYDDVNSVGACGPTGTAAVGQSCANASCVANARCTAVTPGNLRCEALCDADHPCAAGSCNPIPGIPKSGGYCR